MMFADHQLQMMADDLHEMKIKICSESEAKNKQNSCKTGRAAQFGKEVMVRVKIIFVNRIWQRRQHGGRNKTDGFKRVEKLRFGYKTFAMAVDIGFCNLFAAGMKIMVANICMAGNQVVQQTNWRNAECKHANKKNADALAQKKRCVHHNCHNVAKKMFFQQ